MCVIGHLGRNKVALISSSLFSQIVGSSTVDTLMVLTGIFIIGCPQIVSTLDVSVLLYIADNVDAVDRM